MGRGSSIKVSLACFVIQTLRRSVWYFRMYILLSVSMDIILCYLEGVYVTKFKNSSNSCRWLLGTLDLEESGPTIINDE